MKLSIYLLLLLVLSVTLFGEEAVSKFPREPYWRELFDELVDYGGEKVEYQRARFKRRRFSKVVNTPDIEFELFFFYDKAYESMNVRNVIARCKDSTMKSKLFKGKWLVIINRVLPLKQKYTDNSQILVFEVEVSTLARASEMVGTVNYFFYLFVDKKIGEISIAYSPKGSIVAEDF